MANARLCVTVTGATTAELRRQRDGVVGADLVELRLDTVADPSPAGALAERRGPVIVTCRPTWEGGHFAGSEEERKRILLEAWALGADYVDKAMASADDFNRPMQELTTQYCWGEIWGRPGLDRRTRSIINLAMISALNRPHEVKMHIKGALNNGLTKDQIQEVFLQVAIYCGVPAAVDSFRLAREVFQELDR